MVRLNNTEPYAKKLRLVIVDDEPSIRSGPVDLFPWNSLGYKVLKFLENPSLVNSIKKTFQKSKMNYDEYLTYKHVAQHLQAFVKSADYIDSSMSTSLTLKDYT